MAAPLSPDSSGKTKWWRSAPGRAWVGVLAVPLAMLLWYSTYPGAGSLVAFQALLLVFIMGFVWTGRLVGWAIAFRPVEPRWWLVIVGAVGVGGLALVFGVAGAFALSLIAVAVGAAPWLLDGRSRSGARWMIAPAMVISSLLVTSAELPLRARFEIARGDFEDVVDDLKPRGSVDDWVRLRVPGSVGGYEISYAYQAGPNVILYEAHGTSFVDDAGFAYLPDGPDTRLGSGNWEPYWLKHLGRDWYAWRASW